MHDTFCDGDNLIEDLVLSGKIDKIFTLSDWHTTYITNCDHGKRRNFETLKNFIFCKVFANAGFRNFEALDGPLGAHLCPSWADWVPKRVPKMTPKVVQKMTPKIKPRMRFLGPKMGSKTEGEAGQRSQAAKAILEALVFRVAPRWPNMAPRWPQVAPRWPSKSLKT